MLSTANISLLSFQGQNPNAFFHICCSQQYCVGPRAIHGKKNNTAVIDNPSTFLDLHIKPCCARTRVFAVNVNGWQVKNIFHTEGRSCKLMQCIFSFNPFGIS
jgi:hypothetical protein